MKYILRQRSYTLWIILKNSFQAKYHRNTSLHRSIYNKLKPDTSKKLMKSHLILITILILIFPNLSCKSDDSNVNEMSEKFLDYVKNEEYTNAKGLICEHFRNFDAEVLDFYLKNAHDFIVKYGRPPADKWEVKYDTAREIFKIKKVIIPIVSKEDNNKNVQWSYIELDYDYTRRYIGDSVCNFVWRVSYKHTK